MNELQDFKKDSLEKDSKSKDKVFATVEMVDTKITHVLEKLKNENQMIWKDSLTLAEKQFSEKGIQETMQLLPTSLQGITQLKSTINILDDTYKDGKAAEPNPKPQINTTEAKDKK